MIKERITGACQRCGHSVDDITLIAVTKTRPLAVLQTLIDLGVTNLGENRVTEIIEKTPHLKGTFIMHMIGTLQTNKVARVLPFINTIQSVDRLRIIEYIERYLPEHTTLPAFIEVNTSNESSKNGCTPDEVRMLLDRIYSTGKLQPKGYMTIGPLDNNEAATRKSFAHLSTIAENHRDLISNPQLSMGMSGDFEWAIEEGATMIRIGTLLTGER